MEATIDYTIETCKKENIEKIVDGLNAYNLSKVTAISDVWTPLELVAKDKIGDEIVGILAGIGYWNGLEIRVVWVREDYRGKGIGSTLLNTVEKLARQKGAEISMLDTFDFQAEEFYLKKGYKKIGEIINFPKGHKRIYLSKELKI